MAQFEGYERREAKILETLKKYGISSIDECKEITTAKGIDVDQIVRSTQPICFENAIWAYTVGCAIAIKKGCVKAADAAAEAAEEAAPEAPAPAENAPQTQPETAKERPVYDPEAPNANPVEAGPAVAPRDENGKIDATKIADANDFGDWEEQGCKG